MQIIRELKASLDKVWNRLTKIICIGEVSEVNADSHSVKVILKGHDNIETEWLPVLAARTKGVSVVHNIEVGEQVACLFPPFGDMAKGMVIGSFYNKEDLPFVTDAKVMGVKFTDGSTMTYDENNQTLLFQITKDGPLFEMTSDGARIKANLLVDGEVTVTKTLSVAKAVTFESTLEVAKDVDLKSMLKVAKDVTFESNLKVKKEVMDKSGSMSMIRMIYSGHNHVTAVGPTTPPNQPMA